VTRVSYSELTNIRTHQKIYLATVWTITYYVLGKDIKNEEGKPADKNASTTTMPNKRQHHFQIEPIKPESKDCQVEESTYQHIKRCSL
jgi:hypothetical protein